MPELLTQLAAAPFWLGIPGQLHAAVIATAMEGELNTCMSPCPMSWSQIREAACLTLAAGRHFQDRAGIGNITSSPKSIQ